MFSTLRTRFGIPGVISVMALVFAMFGGAYAASNASDGGKATASAKAKKGPRGPKGATGPAGPAGPAGPQGPAGANGKDGADGSNGSNGASGANGQSVTTEAEPPFGECGEEEGVKMTSVSGVDYVCNGAAGATGAPGNPWTLGGTLPNKATETGTWAFSASRADTETGVFPDGAYVHSVSFPIPLTAPPTPHYVGYAEGFPEPTPAQCENPEHAGAANVDNPEADPGHLCVYAGGVTLPATKFFEFGTPGTPPGEAGISGALILFKLEGTKATFGEGTWAVTG